MPDWNEVVRERLLPLDLPSEKTREVVAELTAHLEDFYEEQIRNGIGESEAQQRTLNEVARWRLLAKNIQRVKREEGTMNARTKQLWLPGIVSLTTAIFSPMLVAL